MMIATPAAAAPHAVDRENPWPGLAAYEEGDSDLFKGRDEEIAAVLRRIVREDVTLLWGFSGLGKTSLLRAGLFPRLREADIFPVYIRLCYAHASDGREAAADASVLREQCFEAIRQAAARWRYEVPAQSASGTLWEYVRRRNDRFWGPGDRLVTPLLVFDQFEELFTRDHGQGFGPEAIDAFFRDVSDALVGCPPEWLLADGARQEHEERGEYLFRPGVFKVLLSFREDFLAQVAGFQPLVRAIDHNYYRLEAMSVPQAIAVVAQAGGHLLDDSSPEGKTAICQRIVERVAAAPAAAAQASATVDPALLSLFCRELNESRRHQRKPLIDRALVESGEASQIISRFYDSCMTEVSAVARVFVEDRLVLGESRSRESQAEETAFQSGVTRQELDFLIERRILRREENRRGQRRLELTHDVLVEPALAARNRRKLEEERIEKERRQRERLERERDAEARERQARELAAKASLARRRKVYISVLTAATIVAAVMAIAAVDLAREEITRGLIQIAEQQVIHDPQLATIFSRRAAEEALSHPGLLAGAEVALNRAVREASHLASTRQWNGASAAISPDGTRLALVGDGGRRVTVCEGATFSSCVEPIVTGTGPKIVAVHFVRDDGSFVVIRSDGSLDWISTNASRANSHVAAPVSPSGRIVLGCAFNVDRSQVLVASFVPEVIDAAPSRDRTVRRWVSLADVRAGRWVSDVEIDSRAGADFVLADNGERYAVIDRSRQVAVMDVITGRVARHRFDGDVTVRLSRDGSLVIGIPTGAGPDDGMNRMVSVWSVTRDTSWTLALPGRDEILSTTFSPDGRALATVQAPGIAQVWNLETRRPVYSVPIAAEGVVFSPDSRELLSWDHGNAAQLWTLATGDPVLRLSGHHEPIAAAAIASATGPIVTMSASAVKVWSRHGIDTSIATRHTHLRAVAFSPDGRSLAAGGHDTRLVVADARRGGIVDEPAAPGDVTAVAFSRDGRSIAAGTVSGTIRIHSAAPGGAADRTIEDGRGPIKALSFADSDAVIAYAVQFDKPRAAVPAGDGRSGAVIMTDVRSGAVLMEREVTGEIMSLTLAADHRRFAVSVFEPPKYDTAQAEPRISFHAFELDASGSSPEHPRQSNMEGPGAEPPVLRAVHQAFAAPTAGAYASDVRPAADVSADLRFAVSTNLDRHLVPWVLPDRPQLPIPFGDDVRSIAVSPDGRHFAAGGERGTIKLYTSGARSDPVVLQASGPAVVALTFNATGDALAGVRADGAITIYPFGAHDLLNRARSIVGDRQPTAAECMDLGDLCSAGIPTWKVLLRQMGALLEHKAGAK